MTSPHPLLTAAVLLLAAAPSAAAQAPDIVVRGVVRDEANGTAIAGARVRMTEARRGTLTDSTGAFTLDAVGRGVHVLSVEQYGYEALEVTFEAGPEALLSLDIAMMPLPVMLDGIDVVADRLSLMESRLRSRRRAVASATRAFEQDRLVQTAATDMLQFLMLEASLEPTPCGRRPLGGVCFWRRGQLISPTVYIDEAPVIGGLDQLSTYQPHDLYLVEVYGQGMEIRAYTHLFMERMARRPVALIPIGVERRWR